jgi:hypothetical protein
MTHSKLRKVIPCAGGGATALALIQTHNYLSCSWLAVTPALRSATL